MADFGFLSDTDDSAVEDLIAQTRDLCVLEQVAAVNCSGFNDSDLPSELESRFRRLKSFPVAKANPKIAATKSLDRSSGSGYGEKRGCESASSSDEISETFSQSERKSDVKIGFTNSSRPGREGLKSSVKSGTEYHTSSDEEIEIFSDAKEAFDPKMGSVKKSGCGNISISKKESLMKRRSECDDDETEVFEDFKREPDVKTGSSSSSFSKENQILSASKQKSYGKKDSKPKSKHGSVSSLSRSSNSSSENVLSPSKKKTVKKKKSNSKPSAKSSDQSSSGMVSSSPPQTLGCLWCSPKKSSKKKTQGRKKRDADFDSDIDEFLSDLNAFPVKEQKKMLRKALEEQQKVRREAAKIVKMAKQASSRMDFHGLEDELSDD